MFVAHCFGALEANVSDDEVTLSVSIPLDSDGFMRRQCPTCEREFKSRPTPDGEEPVPVPDGGYFCPYCGVQAPLGSWFTKAQAELAQAIAVAEVVDAHPNKKARSNEVSIETTRAVREERLIGLRCLFLVRAS
jgi:uncharacterized Zn finger protein (UPF0148 family)